MTVEGGGGDSGGAGAGGYGSVSQGRWLVIAPRHDGHDLFVRRVGLFDWGTNEAATTAIPATRIRETNGLHTYLPGKLCITTVYSR